MSVGSFDDLMEHVGHKIVIATYGSPVGNVAIECEDCKMVLLDFDKPVRYRNPLYQSYKHMIKETSKNDRK